MDTCDITIGQELEYIVLGGDKDGFYVLPELIASRQGRMHGSHVRDYTKPGVHIDRGGVLELVSRVHKGIGSLYEEMGELDEIAREICVEQGFDLSLVARNAKKEKIVANQVSIVRSSWLDKWGWVEKDHPDLFNVHAGLCPYIPLLVALTNNSPTRGFPHGSARLREKRYSSQYKSGNSYALAIRFNTNNYVLEARAMDKGKCVEDDVAAAAVTLALVKFLCSENQKHKNSLEDLSMLQKANLAAHEMYGFGMQRALYLAMEGGVTYFPEQITQLFDQVAPFMEDLPRRVQAVVDGWVGNDILKSKNPLNLEIKDEDNREFCYIVEEDGFY